MNNTLQVDNLERWRNLKQKLVVHNRMCVSSDITSAGDVKFVHVRNGMFRIHVKNKKSPFTYPKRFRKWKLLPERVWFFSLPFSLNHVARCDTGRKTDAYIFGMFQSTNQVKCKMSFPCFRFDVILPFSDNLFIRVSEENRIPNFLENWFLIKSTDTHSIRILLWLEEESHFNLSAVSSARNTFRPLCVYIKVKLLVKYALALFDTLRKCK